MTFRALNGRFLEPASMWIMILGIAALCQPWNEFLHRYGLTTIIVGLVGFLITSHISPAPKDTHRAFDVSDHHEGKS